ncbi:MAG TPA: BatD family protein [Chitinophagaceae bacterium]|nr:BatD family protein [Chitinophagaceae bacterium]
MRWFFFFFALLFCTALVAQQSLQTIVPVQPIAVGASFQVQYIVTDGDVVEVESPAFGRDFRFVSGPRLYEGQALINGTKIPIRNFSYTLIPLRKGRLVVKGATVLFKAGKKKSNDAVVIVQDKAPTDALTATPASNLPRLAAGPAWDKQLGEQLFIKTAVSRQQCFVGDPVEATFTLFSRLPSASEIIKNPGFYGFSVLDMPDATDGQQTVQTHNDTFYNTHVLRHVQLYPMQSGTLTLDKMTVANAIEYADSASGAAVQTTVLLESSPVTISVKPLPPATTPGFAGAVGTFSIQAQLDKKEWRQNSNGKLLITLKGAGNFLQVSAPDVAWPKGIDVFEPALSERLQKETTPVRGTRTYTYAFTTDSTGTYVIPPVLFTYFNAAEKKYKTVATDSLPFTVTPGRSRALLPVAFRKKIKPAPAIGWGLVVALAAAAGVVWYQKKKGTKKENAAIKTKPNEPDFETTITAISETDESKYRRLQQALMGFLKSYDLQAPTAEANTIQQVSASLTAAKKEDLQQILAECEAVQYYNAAPSVPFRQLQEQALYFIRSVNKSQV